MGHTFTFAVFGDTHGRQIEMYRRVMACRRSLDLVLQVGDFETHRDMADVASKTGPQRFRVLGDFHRLLSWDRVPVPTAFIAGNHEAFRWLDGYADGFELLPGLGCLGRFGVRRAGPILVAGLSGIFHPEWFGRPRDLSDGGRRFRRPGRATAYFRLPDLENLTRRLDSPPDVLLLHDWPAGLVPAQARRGNGPARELVEALRPQWVFCGHHHVHAAATIPHPDGTATRVVALGVFGGERPTWRLRKSQIRGSSWSSWPNLTSGLWGTAQHPSSFPAHFFQS
jgi:lariat debranching enzyme